MCILLMQSFLLNQYPFWKLLSLKTTLHSRRDSFRLFSGQSIILMRDHPLIRYRSSAPYGVHTSYWLCFSTNFSSTNLRSEPRKQILLRKPEQTKAGHCIRRKNFISYKRESKAITRSPMKWADIFNNNSFHTKEIIVLESFPWTGWEEKACIFNDVLLRLAWCQLLRGVSHKSRWWREAISWIKGWRNLQTVCDPRKPKLSWNNMVLHWTNGSPF